MKSSTTSSKGNAIHPTRGIGHSPNEYPPPQHYGRGYPPAGYASAPPPPTSIYNGHPSPSQPYGAFPQPYNTGSYAPQAYGCPNHPPPPPANAYAPPPQGYPPAANGPAKGKKGKKKSGMSKMLGLGAGLLGAVVGGLFLDDLAGDGAAAASELFSDAASGLDQVYDASLQSVSDSMDLIGTIG